MTPFRAGMSSMPSWERFGKPSHAERRAEWIRQQRDGCGAFPVGVDGRRVPSLAVVGWTLRRRLRPAWHAATAQLLWAKRVRTMARAWPELAAVLDTGLVERATEVLAGTPLSSGDHAVQDGFI